MARENKTSRTLSDETKKKISDARRARTKQPRSGQSKKRQSFYQELKHDYGKNKEALAWIEKNKEFMDGSGHEVDHDAKAIDNPGDHQSKELGIMTEYSEMYSNFYEFRIASVIFGKNASGDEDSDSDIGNDPFETEQDEVEQEEEIEYGY